MHSLKEFKLIFDPTLEKFLTERINRFLKNSSDPLIKDLCLQGKDLILNAGKRVRPYIAYCMYKASGGQNDEKAIKFFVSLEIFHMFLLIHDDFMDKAKLRHSATTAHEFINNKLKSLNRKGDLRHVANSQAVLLGDLLFAWTCELIDLNKDFPQENLLQVKKIFYLTLDEVILGQMIDIDLTTQTQPSINLIDQKTLLKTAYYSFIRPMQIGAALGNPNNNYNDFTEEFGKIIGMTFQIQDDYLDIYGNPKQLHKNILGDVSQGEPTFFTNYIFEKGTEEEKTLLRNVFGKKLNNNKRKQIKNLFFTSGAIKAGEETIKNNIQTARKIVEKTDINLVYKQRIFELIDLLENRKS